MNYQITGLCPRDDITMGRWGFGIRLFPGFKDDVGLSGIDGNQVEIAIKNMGRGWLDGCGYNKLTEYDGRMKPLYIPREIRVSWGEWGPEHISVPGNACGLDLGDGVSGPPGGKILQPHNIDSMSQAMLLTIVFTWFAEIIYFFAEDKKEQ